jgi:FKBP-type peptidyl-prolyl cis-trans isomerase
VIPPIRIGSASSAKSTVAVSKTSFSVAGTTTVTLTARDQNGRRLTTGGATVTFALGTGAGHGTIGTVTDNHNGTYTTTLTGTTAGANTITATLNGQAVTTTAPAITIIDNSGMTATMPAVTDSHWVAGANGLKTWDVVTGSGTPVAAADKISVFYTGWLASNGTSFDSRRSPSASADFTLTNLIQGWQKGLIGMKPGGIRRLSIPAALGYGATGSPPKVPANADLVFEIKLVSTNA